MPSIDLNCDLGELRRVHHRHGCRNFALCDQREHCLRVPRGRSVRNAKERSAVQKVRRAGGCTPGTAGFAGLWPPQNGNFPAEAEADVMYQIGALKAFCDAAGVPLHHVKPHGALYNMAARDPVLAAAICRAVQAAAPGAVLLALSGSEMVKAANAIGLPVASEVFADRGYQADGSLVPRGAPCAMIEDEDTAIARVLQMAAQGTVQADDGSTVTLQADSVCVHGDGPKALAFVQKSPPPSLPQGQQLQHFDCRQKAR